MVSISTQTLWSLPPLCRVENCPTPEAEQWTNSYEPPTKVRKFHSQLIQRYYTPETSSRSPEQCAVTSSFNPSPPFGISGRGSNGTKSNDESYLVGLSRPTEPDEHLHSSNIPQTLTTPNSAAENELSPTNNLMNRQVEERNISLATASAPTEDGLCKSPQITFSLL